MVEFTIGLICGIVITTLLATLTLQIIDSKRED